MSGNEKPINFIMQQDNDPKSIDNTTNDYIRGKKLKVFALAKTPKLSIQFTYGN